VVFGGKIYAVSGSNGKDAAMVLARFKELFSEIITIRVGNTV